MIWTDISWSKALQGKSTLVHIVQSRYQIKPGMRSHDEIKLHHEFIKTSLFISAVDLITICSTKIIKRFKNRKIYSHDSNVHLDRIYAKKYTWKGIGIGLYGNSKNFRIYVDMKVSIWESSRPDFTWITLTITNLHRESWEVYCCSFVYNVTFSEKFKNEKSDFYTRARICQKLGFPKFKIFRFWDRFGPGNPDKVPEIRINVRWLTGIRSWTGQIGAEYSILEEFVTVKSSMSGQ